MSEGNIVMEQCLLHYLKREILTLQILNNLASMVRLCLLQSKMYDATLRLCH